MMHFDQAAQGRDPRLPRTGRAALCGSLIGVGIAYSRVKRVEIQNQLRTKTVVVDFEVDVKAVAAAARKGLKLAGYRNN